MKISFAIFVLLFFGNIDTIAQFTPKVDSTKRDTVRLKQKPKFTLNSLKPKTEAGKRFWNSMAVPGLGQIKNRQYGYLPFIYGGAATAGYFIFDNSRKYRYFQDLRLESFNDGKGVKEVTVKRFFPNTNRTFDYNTLKPVTDQYRRQTELSIIGLTLGWVMQAIQANVGYHLKTFDTKDDLTIRLKTIDQQNSQSFIGIGATYSFSSK